MARLKIYDGDFPDTYFIEADIHRVKERSWVERYETFLSSCGIPYKEWQKVRTTWPKLAELVSKVKGVLPILIKKGDKSHALMKEASEPQYQKELSLLWANLEKKKGIIPFDWQKSGTEWLLCKERACLADDTGLGKSGQLLMTSMVLHHTKEIDGVLIVSSKAGGLTWQHEVPMWSSFKLHIIKSKKDFRWPKRGEVVFCTWKKLQYSKLNRAPHKTLLIGDEIHNVNNPKAKQTKVWNAVKNSVLARGGRVLGASASVNENSPLDLWNGLDACGCADEIFGNFSNFKKLFHGTQGTYGIVWDEEAKVDPIVKDMMKGHTLRRSKRDVLPSLPPLIGPRMLRVELSTRDPRWKALSELQDFIDKSQMSMTAFLHWAATTKDTQFIDISEVRKVISSIKIPAALDYAAEYATKADPLIVMASNRAAVEEFDKLKDWAIICGGVSDKLRQKAMDDLNNGKLLGVACTIRAASESITLSAARRLLLIDQDWNWARNYQGIGRIERLNQKRTMFVDVLSVANSIDDRIQEVLAKKIKWKEGTFAK